MKSILIIGMGKLGKFLAKDFSNLEDGLGIITNYFSTVTLILAIAGIAALVLGAVILFRKAPKLSRKINYKKAAVTIALIIAMTFGAVQLSIKAGILDTR